MLLMQMQLDRLQISLYPFRGPSETGPLLAAGGVAVVVCSCVLLVVCFLG